MTPYPSILIAMPAYGGQVTEQTLQSVYKTCKEFDRLGVRHNLLTVANESLICRGRSKLFSFFFNVTDYDYMIFIDSDIGFDPSDIIKLLELKVPFSCAGVPLKSLNTKYNFGILTNAHGELIWNANKTAFSVSHVGTAFMMIHRSVYSILSEKHPELKFTPSTTHTNLPVSQKEINNSYHLFQTMIKDSDIKSEDYAFCSRWIDAGGDIWLRPDINLTHTGSHVFTGKKLTDIFGAPNDKQ